MYGNASITALQPSSLGGGSSSGIGLLGSRSGSLRGSPLSPHPPHPADGLFHSALTPGQTLGVVSEDQGARSFLDALRARAAKATARGTDATDSGASDTGAAKDPARAAAEDFVALTFVQPILKQLRESNQTAAPFAPGQAEKTFQGLADEEIARRIVRASQWGLVDRIASDLAKAQQPTALSESPESSTVDRGA